jgi:hypothetical protein
LGTPLANAADTSKTGWVSRPKIYGSSRLTRRPFLIGTSEETRLMERKA